jgi:Tfp pilus assembly protein PilF
MRGIVYYEQDEPELACADWKQAIKLDPNCGTARNALDSFEED